MDPGTRKKRRLIAILAAAVLLAGWLCCLPRNLFRGTPYSTVVEARDGQLLGARIASDGQWRFPPRDTIPARFATALKSRISALELPLQ